MLKDIPTYFVYGEPTRPLDVGFLHVETLMARRSVHLGRVRPHRHDRMAQLTFWIKGGATYVIEDRILEFRAPAACFVPSGVVHGFTIADDETDAIVVSVADGALHQLAGLAVLPLGSPVAVVAGVHPGFWSGLTTIMDLIRHEYAQTVPGSATPDRTLMPLIAAAFAQVARIASASAEPAGSSQRVLATDLRRLIDLHFRERWPVERYAEALRTTPYRLARSCESTFGMQVKELVSERRFLEAKRLLTFTIRSNEDVAYELGFKDAAYFSRFFRQRAGEPPGSWRRRQVAALNAVVSLPGRSAASNVARPA